MEIADTFVVNKADREGADKVAADVQVMLKMLKERDWVPPVTLVSSQNNTGVDEVRKILHDHWNYLKTTDEGKRRRFLQLEMEVEAILRGEISALTEKVWKKRKDAGVLEDLAARKTDPYTLASEMISQIIK
jgi:LAO/AO transport system kinase